MSIGETYREYMEHEGDINYAKRYIHVLEVEVSRRQQEELSCPICGKERDWGNIERECCNPECEGEWDTGCYCCHDETFLKDAVLKMQHKLRKKVRRPTKQTTVPHGGVMGRTELAKELGQIWHHIADLELKGIQTAAKEDEELSEQILKRAAQVLDGCAENAAGHAPYYIGKPGDVLWAARVFRREARWLKGGTAPKQRGVLCLECEGPVYPIPGSTLCDKCAEGTISAGMQQLHATCEEVEKEKDKEEKTKHLDDRCPGCGGAMYNFRYICEEKGVVELECASCGQIEEFCFKCRCFST